MASFEEQNSLILILSNLSVFSFIVRFLHSVQEIFAHLSHKDILSCYFIARNIKFYPLHLYQHYIANKFLCETGGRVSAALFPI